MLLFKLFTFMLIKLISSVSSAPLDTDTTISTNHREAEEDALCGSPLHHKHLDTSNDATSDLTRGVQEEGWLVKDNGLNITERSGAPNHGPPYCKAWLKFHMKKQWRTILPRSLLSCLLATSIRTCLLTATILSTEFIGLCQDLNPSV